MDNIVPLPSAWQALLIVSEEMLELARDEDWLGLAEKDLQRQPLLKKYFSSAAGVSDILQTERILQLQAIEKELLGLCRAVRDATANRLNKFHRGKSADKAYLSNAS